MEPENNGNALYIESEKKRPEVDYTENNGCIGNPITNQLMAQDRAALGAEEAGAVVVDLTQAEKVEAPEAEQIEQTEAQP